MEVIVCFVITAITVVALHKFIERVPWLFYLAAAALSLAFGTGLVSQSSYGLYLALVPMMRRCELAFSLLAIVMFTGVFPHSTKLYGMLAPIRGNLAIVAALLATCHVLLYARSYLAKVGVAFSGLNAATYAALAFATLIVSLLAVLSVTSLRPIHNRMDPATWRRIQRLSYVFFPFVAAHALLMIGPAALAGGSSAANALAYLAIVATYLISRIARFFCDKHKEAAH